MIAALRGLYGGNIESWIDRAFYGITEKSTAVAEYIARVQSSEVRSVS